MLGHVVEKVHRTIKKMEMKEPIIAYLGITYKESVDDLREGPALKIVEILIKRGYKVRVCQPNVDKHDRFDLYSLEEAVENASCLLILGGNKASVDMDLDGILGEIGNKIIIDITGILKGQGHRIFSMSGSMVG